MADGRAAAAMQCFIQIPQDDFMKTMIGGVAIMLASVYGLKAQENVPSVPATNAPTVRTASAGWRTDGTGTYPQAVPPTAWAKDKNIVWTAPLSKWSNATPVLTGDRVFTLAEPDELVCVSVTDGRILWRKANPLEEVLNDEQKKTALENEEKLKPFKEKFDATSKEFDAAEKLVQAEFADIRSRREAAQKELAEAEKALEASPGNAELPAKVTEARAKKDAVQKETAETEKQIHAKPEVITLKARSAEIRARRDALAREMAALQIYQKAKTHPTNGYTSFTPVTDGRSVFVQFGTGVVASYDLEGTRRWSRFLERPEHDWGQCASPQLVGDRLLVHFNSLFALDPATGKELWKTASPWGWGTSFPARIGDTDVLLTAKGDVVGVADGQRLATRLTDLTYNSPVVEGRIVYYIQGNSVAYRLPDQLATPLVLEKLWTATLKEDRYYGSPLVYKGYLYAITQNQVFTVLNAKDGVKLCEKKLNLTGGTVYPSITAAGACIFVSSDKGVTLVLEAGPECKELSLNTLDAFRSSPVFAGKRMYLRTYSALYCIGE
jgi:outer membrane protein assembly factor BamB